MVTDFICGYASAGYIVMELDGSFITAILAAGMCPGDEVLFPVIFEFFKRLDRGFAIDLVVPRQDAFNLGCKDYAVFAQRGHFVSQVVDPFSFPFELPVFFPDAFGFSKQRVVFFVDTGNGFVVFFFPCS